MLHDVVLHSGSPPPTCGLQCRDSNELIASFQVIEVSTQKGQHSSGILQSRRVVKKAKNVMFLKIRKAEEATILWCLFEVCRQLKCVEEVIDTLAIVDFTHPKFRCHHETVLNVAIWGNRRSVASPR